jgi:SAM-dependent methyltransferase
MVYKIRRGIPILLPTYNDEVQERYRKSYENLARDDLTEPLEADRDNRHSVLVDFIGKVSGLRILDIGSSDGKYLGMINGRFKVAFDLAYPFLAAITKHDSVIPICGDAEYLPFKAGFFDIIIVSDILEHLLRPERLVQRLREICGPDTRVIVHVPWDEDISVYRDAKYEFTHLRSFSSYSFAQLWEGFYVEKEQSTYPSMEEPIVFKLDRRIPRVLYNFILYIYYKKNFNMTEYRWRSIWIKELPKRERWLLHFYRPKFRMFALRTYAGASFLSLFSILSKILLFWQKGENRRDELGA